MKKRITIKENWKIIRKHEILFRKQEPFPPLIRSYESRMLPILHTGRLMFIRSKFLYLGAIESLELKNEYVFYAIIKSLWENVASFGYYHIKISDFINQGKEDQAYMLARKMGLGGRKFPTQKMVENTGGSLDEFTLPNILTMMDVVDHHFVRQTKEKGGILRNIYDEQIAEGGHTTYTGLIIAGRWSQDKQAHTPDVNKKWEARDKGSLVNIVAMSALLFFYYWEKFEKIESQ